MSREIALTSGGDWSTSGHRVGMVAVQTSELPRPEPLDLVLDLSLSFWAYQWNRSLTVLLKRVYVCGKFNRLTWAIPKGGLKR
jgi:hypothetical protein